MMISLRNVSLTYKSLTSARPQAFFSTHSGQSNTLIQDEKFRWKRSHLLAPVEKNLPNDAVVKSPSVNAASRIYSQGNDPFKTARGIYNLLPLGLRSLEKLVKLIDEEMRKIGGQKVQMPTLTPAELWKESGRLQNAGPELMRFEDRKGSQFCLGPTHEEAVTDIVRGRVTSPRQLPLRLYQITTKFRDEIRPKHGLMRAREFLMKDMYSFDADQNGARKTYDAVRNAYSNIFKALGLRFVIADADSGNIGGFKSEEFQVIADVGDDFVLECSNNSSCNFASNVEKSPSILVSGNSDPKSALQDITSRSDVRIEFFDVVKDGKTLHKAVVALDENREVNSIKIKKILDADEVESIPSEKVQGEVQKWQKGGEYESLLRTFIDDSVLAKKASSPSNRYGFLNSALFSERPPQYGDFRNATNGDRCPSCSSGLISRKGIECGHVFNLGTKYSKSMQATYTNGAGNMEFLEMGCYGLGVGRILATVVETSHDQHGIIWPAIIAPYKIVIITIGPKNEQESLQNQANELYDTLESHGMENEVIIEDREEQPGYKMNDAKFLGFPYIVVIGKAMKKEGKYELQIRSSGESILVTKDELFVKLRQHGYSNTTHNKQIS